jgi:hypothetical protein
MRHLLCVDKQTGHVKWTRSHAGERSERDLNLTSDRINSHGFASHTPACDDHGVYVFFGADGAHAYSHEGKRRWSAPCGTGCNPNGTASSPIVHDNIVIVNAHVESGQLFGFNVRTGEVVWNVRHGNGYTTPTIVRRDDGPQLMVQDGRQVLAYNPGTGDLLRQISIPDSMGGGASLVGASDLLFCQHANLSCVGRDGNVLWNKPGGNAVLTPVNHDGLVYASMGGLMRCFDARSGDELYIKRLPADGQVLASPVVADGKIFCVSDEGGTSVLAVGPEYRLLAHNQFAEDDSFFKATKFQHRAHTKHNIAGAALRLSWPTK